MREDFFSTYLQYTNNNESPSIFHRWSAISAIGALLGRSYSQEFGHQMIAPTVYCMLMGTPGTRKSTAIKIAKKLIQQVGYDTIAATKTTKEKFLLDLAGVIDGDKSVTPDDFLNTDLLAGPDESTPREIYIMADEFNDFFGNNILEFVSLLGNLWDYEGIFENRIKNGQSVRIPWPTVSLIGGNTPVNISTAFPAEVIGQGFFSRLLFIHGTSMRDKITFPTPPNVEDTAELLRMIKNFRIYCLEPAKRTAGAEKLLDKIYKNWNEIQDSRFEYYGQRRLIHLLKICAIHSAARVVYSEDQLAVITEEDVVAANTVLSAAEHGMPKALGEFGKSKNSDIVHAVINILEKSTKPVEFKDLYSQMINDAGNINEFAKIMQSMQVAGKVHIIAGGYMLIRKQMASLYMEAIDWSYLTEEERKMINE